MRDVLRQLTAGLEGGRELILCQVVETKGSTPQKAGALMLVDTTGGQAGTLGGGCVEAEVKQKAIRQIGQPGADLHSFLLDHDYGWADGLICGGKMVILTESLRGQGPLDYFGTYQSLLEAGDGLTEAVVLDPERAGAPLGTRLLFGPDDQFRASWPRIDVPDALRKMTPVSLDDRPRPSVRQGIAYLPVLPRIRLIIVGAGHVGQEVGVLAARNDFDVWVVDDRRQYANSERFPDAQQCIVGPFDEVLPKLEITPRTYALIVTRGHGHDQEALAYLAPSPASYVGLIGSRRKIKLICESLRESGMADSALARVAAPVGLSIGSQTVPEIAVSIVAELIARRNLGERALALLRSSEDPKSSPSPEPARA
jgi:xanthine dehydrogenase accessory factor